MKIGDKVSVIDDDLRGTVTSVCAGNVTFSDEHGFTYTYPATKLAPVQESLYHHVPVEKKPEDTRKISKKHNRKPFILDLHFEKLASDPARYDSFERLLIQKQKLLETLDYCRKNHLKHLEIVHGIGDGILQQTVWETLEAQTGLEFYNKDILHHQSGAVIVHLQ